VIQHHKIFTAYVHDLDIKSDRLVLTLVCSNKNWGSVTWLQTYIGAAGKIRIRPVRTDSVAGIAWYGSFEGVNRLHNGDGFKLTFNLLRRPVGGRTPVEVLEKLVDQRVMVNFKPGEEE
jgi:hypothetical protein